MKGKGLIQFFSVALILICIYQLTFNFVTNKVEKKAESYAKTRVLGGKDINGFTAAQIDSLNPLYHLARQQYLDSVSGETVFNLGIVKFSYEKCKQQQLNLGLDLKGGMNVVMEVSIQDLVRNLAGDNVNDPVFQRILARADSLHAKEGTTVYITHFERAYNEKGAGKQLASFFNTRSNQGSLKGSSTNEEVLTFLRSEAKDAFDRTYKILKTRIDKTGVTQPNITAQANTGRITIELPGVENPARVKRLLQATAKLEFWEMYENPEFLHYLSDINTGMKKHMGTTADSSDKKSTAKVDTSKHEAAPAVAGNNTPDPAKVAMKTADSNKNAVAASKNLKADSSSLGQDKENPFFKLLNPYIGKDEKGQQDAMPGPVVGLALGKDTARINKILSEDWARDILPKDAKLVWSARSGEHAARYYDLYAIKMPADNKAPMDGEMIASARQDYDQDNGKPDIDFTLTGVGTNTWARLTREVAAQNNNTGGYIGIVLDDYMQSCPHNQKEIDGGRAQITGSFEVQDAKDLANVLETGKLPTPARIVAEDVVGPSLGAESITAGVRSIAIAFLAILAFMVLYYNTSGWISNFALFFNLLFILGILASRGATLTLPGIAGLVLTMGMAVDANVLIHERIKEELARGKSLAKAVMDGHTKSYSAIFDTHLTTLITGLILAYFGLGPVLGYAITLNWGIVMTLFTAVFMAHLVFDWLLKRNKNIKFTTPISKKGFTHYNIQFVNKRKYAYIFSGTLAIIGLVSIFTKGFDYGVDFKGGRSYVVEFDKSVPSNDLRDGLTKSFGSAPVIKTMGSDNRFKITTAYMVGTTTPAADSMAKEKLFEGIKSHLPPALTFNKFKDNQKYLQQTSIVGASISDDIRSAAVKAILFSMLGIFLYILFRFRKWQFALGALVSLAHDVLMVMGLFSIFAGIVPFSLEVDEQFVAAALTVMGYSVADTVIVFDRIREYLKEHPTMDMKKCINDAINSTLNRTMMTSATVLLVLLILFLFGGEVIRGFSFALLIGIGFGTYSSIFVATPIVVDLAGKSFNRRSTTGAAAPPAKAMANKD